MVRIVVSNAADTSDCGSADWGGLTITGKVGSRPVIAGPKRPLQLWEHVLQPGGSVEWRQSQVSHLVYVLDGAAYSSDEPLTKDGSLIVAGGASATLRAGDAPLTLLHFHPSPESVKPTRSGGCVHLVNRKDAPYYTYDSPETQRKFTDGVVFADSGCSSCGLWLHESRLPGDVTIGRHFHTEDEIIVVLDGCLKLGRQELRLGDAVAIDANTMYTFKTGADGLRFINFRPSEPYVVMATPDGKNTPPMSEKQWMADHTV
jgi:quercetin dioxygenase-like cupin family protein